MAFITREDGVHFVIPSYRDVLTVKSTSQLRTDVLALSKNYGEYATIQKKGPNQYDVAFSREPGYLLGESIWSYFKRPTDMIYCEAIPNTSEVILVIAKNGSVYLDGKFPSENISEELVIFLTQENNFEIFVYGDVPISQTPEAGKFSFEANSVKSFSVLDKPVFPTLPLNSNYQLQLVSAALRGLGIGALPVKQIVYVIVLLVLAYMMWEFFLKPAPVVEAPVVEVNIYEPYENFLKAPDPAKEIPIAIIGLNHLITIPGWSVTTFKYIKGEIIANVTSNGGKVEDLMAWARSSFVTVDIRPDGIYLIMKPKPPEIRPKPTKIYPLKEVLARFIDLMTKVNPGNNLVMSEVDKRGEILKVVTITVNVDAISPAGLDMIGQQLRDLPVVLRNITLNVDNGKLTGTLIIEAAGS